MARPNLWQSISAWFNGKPASKPGMKNFEPAEDVYARALASSRAERAASVFQPACNIYIRADGTWIFPMNDRDGMGVMVSPATKVDTGAGPSELGAATLAAMDLSRRETSDPATPWPPSNAAKEAGFKSHGDLERGAAHLGVSRSAEGVIISAWAAAKGGGYEPVTGAERTCSAEASAIGAAILELSKLCTPKTPPTARNASGAGGADDAGKSLQSDPDDPPAPFGYKMSWIAVPAADGRAVAEVLGLGEIEACSWENGIKHAYKHEGVFITPPVAGWIIAAGSLPEVTQGAFVPLLERLSARYGRAFYFGTHRIVGYQAWAFADKGKMRRAFGYLGERGEFLLNLGDRTPEEIELGLGVSDEDETPGEEDVLDVAGKWVLDPRELDQFEDACGPGWFGNR